MAQQMGILFVISGPSGAGKGTVCKELLAKHLNIAYSISATTRAPRVGEVDGVNYHFIDKQAFQKMLAKDQLLEYAEVYGNYYGTPRTYVERELLRGKDVLLEIDIQGALKVKNKMPEAILIYIMPPSLQELSTRIWRRGTDNEDTIRKRLSCVTSEIEQVKEYQYVVINDKVEEAVVKIEAIMTAEKCATWRNSCVTETFFYCDDEGGLPV